MRKFVLCVLMLVVLHIASPIAQQGRWMGGVGITVFEEYNFRGENATFREDIPSLRRYNLNDRISSLQVAPGEMWEVCEDDNYRGRCQVFSGNESNLGGRGWNNKISSLRRVSTTGRPPTYPPTEPTYPPSGGYGIELFADRNYRGDRRVITGEVTDLRSLGFNDRAESLRVAGGQAWEVCSDNYFRNCTTISSSAPDLRRIGKNKSISSVRPAGQPGGGYPPTGPGMRLVAYEERGYRGRSRTLTNEQSTIYGMRAESLRVTGTWQVCDAVNFGGRCDVVSGDVHDVRALGLRGPVMSARPSGMTPR